MPDSRTVKRLFVGVLFLAVVAIGIATTSDWSSRTTGALTFLFGLIAVLVMLATADASARPGQAPDEAETEDAAAKVLTRKVEDQWNQERVRRRLANTAPVQVRFRAMRSGALGVDPKDLLRADDSFAECAPHTMDQGTIDDLHALYLSLPRRRLVVVGDGGTGKTVALIRLVIKAASAREDEPSNPVPVLLTAADWTPDRRNDATLARWAAQQIYRQHPYLSTETYGGNVVERLLAAGRIAVFLDGLDEMPKPRQRDALLVVAAETRFRIVLTSRLDEIQKAVTEGAFPEGVEFVELLRVPPSVGGQWLQQDQPPTRRREWNKFARAMTDLSGAVVARALDTPLWLSLTRTCYRDRSMSEPTSPLELLDPERFSTAKEIRSHLLERTIQSELEFSRYAKRGRRYLTLFACRFESAGFNWWRIRDLMPQVPAAIAAIACGTAAGVSVGLVSTAKDGVRFGGSMALVGLVIGGLVVISGRRLPNGRMRGTVPRQITATALGLLYGLGISSATRLAEHSDDRSFALLAGALLGLLLGIAIGFVSLHDGPMLAVRRWPSWRDVQAALVAGFACAASASLSGSPARAVIIGITAVAGFAGAAGLTRPHETPGANMGPLVSLRMDIRGSVTLGLVAACAIGIGSAITVPHARVVEAILVGSGIGVTVGVAGAICASQAVALGCIGVWLTLSGRRGPLSIVRFLEFAREQNLVRVAGTAYQLRHRELQEYLREAVSSPSTPQAS